MITTGILSNVNNLIRFLLTIFIFSNVATLECGTVHLHRQLRINIFIQLKKSAFTIYVVVSENASVPDGLFDNGQSFFGSLLTFKKKK